MSNNSIGRLLIDSAELLTEGAVKSSKKHKLDNYLAKYDYQGDKNSGTINVDGKKIQVDRSKLRTMESQQSNGEKTTLPRQTSAELISDNSTIHLDRDFEKLKNNKRRDAVINHEIGHLKNHHLTDPNNTKEGRNAALDSMSKTSSITNFGDTEYKDEIKKELKKLIPDKSRKSSTEKDNIRKENLEKYKKYENDNLHSDRAEYEADAYASQHKNGDHLKRAMRDVYKHKNSEKGINNQIKDLEAALDEKLDLSKEDKVTARKDSNIIAQNDMNQRNKAAKDKTINKQVYRESIEIADMLFETIDFLK